MPLILNIDTTTEKAMVGISDGPQVIAYKESDTQKEHASFLQPAIAALLSDHGLVPSDLAAVAVSSGPGSYTGLRVGMASAKGLCYALNIPLIAIDTLGLMASAAFRQANEQGIPMTVDTIACPMIDARRMEVFTALYDRAGECISSPEAMILDEHSFAETLQQRQILFCGNGSSKMRTLTAHPHAIFLQGPHDMQDMATMADRQLTLGQSSDLAYAEPFYLKAFHSPIKEKK